MKYKKIPGSNYNIHFIKTNKFKKIKIKVNFKEKIMKSKISNRNMLSLILLEATKNYQTRRLLDIACEDLYDISVESNTSSSGNFHLLNFQTTFLDEKYTEEGMNEKSIKFFFEFLFDPFTKGKGFDLTAFNQAKNGILQDITLYNENPNRLALTRLYEIMCPKSNIALKTIGYKEDVKKITPESLLNYYQEVLKTNVIDIFVVGNFNETEMEKIIRDHFKVETEKDETESHMIEHGLIRTFPKKVIEQKKIQQSVLLLGYKLKHVTNFERVYVAPIYNNILGGSPDSYLFKEVREKHSLCYSISSSITGVSNLMIISAGISAKDALKR